MSARARPLACLLLLVGALACAHEPKSPRASEPTPPSADDERESTRRCMSLAEALYGASYPREVIARASGSLRMDADDEALAPLLACLHRARLDEERWPDALIRSLAHAHGAAVWASRMPTEERLARLEHARVRADVTHYWRARVEGSSSEHEPLLRRALEARPGSVPASLALALEQVRQGRAEEGEALLTKLPAEVRPDLQAYVRAAASLARGERHQAASLLEELYRGQLPSTAPDGPEALALRSERLPDVAPLLCAAGRAHASAGERADALRAFQSAGCFEELTALHLEEGDAFSALLASFFASPEAHVRALEASSAHGLLRARLESLARRCEALHGGERCEEHRARLVDLERRSSSQRQDTLSSLEREEVLRLALGLLSHDDEAALPALENADIVLDPRKGRVLVHALQPSPPEPGLPEGTRSLTVLVEKTAQGWRAARLTREMALSPGAP